MQGRRKALGGWIIGLSTVASVPACESGMLAPWSLRGEASVVLGGDGFAATPDANGIGPSIDVYDVPGNLIAHVGDAPHSAQLSFDVAMGGGTTAALVECNQRFGCGQRLFIGPNAPLNLET